MTKLLAIVCILIFPIATSAGPDDAPLAKAGRREISTAEFTERYDLTPWNKDLRTLPVEATKKEFLYTLIAEKLWAQKAVELGFDTSAQVRANFASLEKMFVRDALYRLEITDKVSAALPDRSRSTKDALTARRYREFMTKFFAEKTTEVNGKAYQAAASRIIARIRSKRTSLHAEDTTAVYLEAADFMDLRRSIGDDTLQTVLLRYQNRRSTLAEFVEYIRFDENSFTTSDIGKLKALLSGKLRSFMQGEYLAWEGYARGLDNLAEVKNQLRIWKDNYLYLALRAAFKDSLSVPDEEVREHYEKRMNAGVRDARTFADVKDELRKTLLGMKNYHGLIRYTVGLAREYGVTIDNTMLDACTVTNIFSVTYRYMGFGGRILGAPLISPNTEWVAPWRASRNDNL